MHTPSIYLATVAVLATIASAEGDRPKFYYPRHVKRQVFANTTTSPEKTKQDPFTSFSTKRSLTDFLSGLTSSDTSSPSSSSSGTTGNILDSVLSPILPTSSPDEVTTIHIQTTKFVEPTTSEKKSVQPTSRDTLDLSNLLDPIIGSTGVLPIVTVQPTTSSSADTTETTPSSASGSPVTVGPDGTTSDGSTSSDSSSDSATDGLTGPGTGTTIPTSTKEPLLPGLSSFLGTLFDPTTTEPPSTATEAPSTATASSDAPGTTDLISSILGSLSDLLPAPTTSGLTGPGTTGVTTTAGPDPTTAPASSNPLGSMLSSILDPITSSGSDIVTVTPTLPPVITTSPTDLPPVVTTSQTDLPPITTPTVAPGNGTDTATPTSTDISTPSGPDTTSVTPPPPPPISTSTSAPGNGTETSTPPNVTPTVTPLPPTGNGTETTGPTTPIISPPTASLPTATNGTESVPTITSAPGSSAASLSPSTTVTPPPTQPPSSIMPTGTDSETSMWLPSSIIVASSPTLPPGVTATLQPTGIPSTLPRIISSPNGTEGQPEGTTLIQLGFLFPLNWQFVAENTITANQIFRYLPMGLRYGLALKEDQVLMKSLLPLDTTSQLNYVTTLAQAYIPENMLDTLALDLHAPLSGIYTNPDSSVNQLMNYIDPSIPLQPGAQLGAGDATGTGVGSSPTGNPGGNNGIFDTNSQKTTPKVRSTTVGIAVSCVGAAAAYGAAMFFIARRYKRKKQSHRRSSSITSPSEMRQSSGPALLGGGNYMAGGRISPGDYSYGTNNNRNSGGSRGSAPNSARTQQISGPMMAENSLGWN